MIKKVETGIPGVWMIQPDVYRDARGFFLESYHKERFSEIGITDRFVQDNHSCSSQGVLRGLHYQVQRPQAKLCRVVEGSVLDVAVDIRSGSPTFGKFVTVVLSDEQQNEIYIPPGFAHGFIVLSGRAQFLYKCTEFYDPKDEAGIAWNDPDLRISWGIPDPIVSEKDRKNPRLAEVSESLLPKFGNSFQHQYPRAQ